MRQIQYVSTYIALAEKGLVSKMECPLDQGLLFCNQDNEDNIYLYCISCNYKKILGLDLYEKIVHTVKQIQLHS